MARILYSEEQSFRKVLWIWFILIPIALVSSLSMLSGFYQQLILGEPWGNKPMSDGGLIAALVCVIIVQVLVIGFVVSIRLNIEITQDAFRYKFFTYFTRWKVLSPEQIASYSVEKYTFWKGRGLGYRVEIFAKKERMIIQSAYILTLNMRSGKSILMSIENKEETERAMQKLMLKSENV